MAWDNPEAGSFAEPGVTTLHEASAYFFPMTLTQQAFWYLDRIQRGNPAWNIAVRFHVAGRLDVNLLQAAVDAVVERQDALRTTFAIGNLGHDGWDEAEEADEPVQVVHGRMRVPVLVDDLGEAEGRLGEGLPNDDLRDPFAAIGGRTRPDTADRDARAEALTLREAEQSFALDRGPLLRVRLLRYQDDDHILLLTVHHIIADGWSIGILAGDLMACYAACQAGTSPRLPPLPIQFADYAVWKQEQAGGTVAESDRLYWKTKLQDLGSFEVPSDSPRPRVSAHKGAILSRLLPASLTDGLASLAREQGCTLFAASLAALKLLLYRVTGSTDVYVGTLLAGRDQVELEPLIGVFVNTLVLRTRLAGADATDLDADEEPALTADDRAATMPFSTLLGKVRATVEEAMTHQSLPFSQLMTQLRLKPHGGCSHFYSINFIYQRDFVEPWTGAGLTVTALPSRSPGAIYDLNFFMVRRADGWRFSCEYDRELYAPATVELLLEQFVSVLGQVIRNPGIALRDVLLPAAAGALRAPKP